MSKYFDEEDANEKNFINYVNNILTAKDQRIAELEEQLKNAIVPKFKIGQEVWYIKASFLKPRNSNLDYITIYDGHLYYALTNGCEYREDQLFATKKEAEAKLKELQGE